MINNFEDRINFILATKKVTYKARLYPIYQ